MAMLSLTMLGLLPSYPLFSFEVGFLTPLSNRLSGEVLSESEGDPEQPPRSTRHTVLVDSAGEEDYKQDAMNLTRRHDVLSV
jgi:hypothetical protein